MISNRQLALEAALAVTGATETVELLLEKADQIYDWLEFRPPKMGANVHAFAPGVNMTTLTS